MRGLSRHLLRPFSLDDTSRQMRSQIILIVLTIININVFSQEFAPIGAKWYYTERYSFFEFADDIDYLQATVKKDTIFEDKSCVQIITDYLCWFPYDTQYVYTVNDSVFFYDRDLGMFKTIYVFSAEEGDSWTIPISGYLNEVDSLIVTVDSTGTRMINNFELKVQYVTYFGKDYDEFGNLWDSLSYPSEIVEILGDITYLFLFPSVMSSVCDDNYSGGLRCYDDSFIGHYETGIAPTCEYTFVGVNEPGINKIGLYPNPTDNVILLKSKPENLKSIELIDNLGRPIRKFSPDEEINLEGLGNGFYFIRLMDNSNDYYIAKAIKTGN